MRLTPIEPVEIPLVAAWLGEERNHKWLDFGSGVQRLDGLKLRIMLQRDIHLLRIYRSDDGDDRPVGLVALSDIDRNFGTATVWAVLGEKRYGPADLTTRAVSGLLGIGFRELGLAVINAWTLENNRGGKRILERLGFNFIGRQRSCHVLDGRRYDRLWYDMLAEEYEEL